MQPIVRVMTIVLAILSIPTSLLFIGTFGWASIVGLFDHAKLSVDTLWIPIWGIANWWGLMSLVYGIFQRHTFAKRRFPTRFLLGLYVGIFANILGFPFLIFALPQIFLAILLLIQIHQGQRQRYIG